MKNTRMESFQIIGITVRTTNENDQAAKDIGELWSKFIGEGVLDKIPNKISNAIYSVYTDYENDHTKPYTTILGCAVNNIDHVPTGMVAKTIEAGNYSKFISKGDLTKGVVYASWLEIFERNLNRLYTTDFEVYGEKAQNPTDAEIEIFVATS